MSDQKLRNRREFSPEFKLRLVVQIVSGERTIAELSREHKIKDSLLAGWRDKFLAEASAIFGRGASVSTEAEERIAELERMVGRQQMELEMLKKASKRLL